MEETNYNSVPDPVMKINNFLIGVRGWLLFFVITLLIIGVDFIVAVVKVFIDPRRHIFHLRPEFFMVEIALMAAGIFFPFYIAYQVYKRKHYSLLVAKVFLYVLPLGAFTWNMFIHVQAIPDFILSLMIGLFAAGCLYSLPWLFYFHYSRRVLNTFAFKESSLPNRIQCPYCHEYLLLYTSERNKKEIVCPECQNKISESSFAA